MECQGAKWEPGIKPTQFDASHYAYKSFNLLSVRF